MDIVFTKISDEEHSVQIRREDNSVESTILNSKSFLQHDLAHFAVELELPLQLGYWGLVASGESLTSTKIAGKELGIAESLVGPVQTLMRVEANIDQYETLLKRVQPRIASSELASRLYERVRKIHGHWKATIYSGQMKLRWPELFE